MFLSSVRTPARAVDGSAGDGELAAGPFLSPKKGMRIGERLLSLGLLGEEHLAKALDEKRRSPHKRLGRILIEQGVLSEASLQGVFGQAISQARSVLIDPAAVRILPRDVAANHQALPISTGDGAAIVAVTAACDSTTIEQLKPFFPAGLRIEPRVWPQDELGHVISAAHEHPLSFDGVMAELDAREADGDAGEARKGWNDPAVRFVNAAILEALRLSATAIHLEPRGERIIVSFRVDGVLEARGSLPRRELAAVLLRLEALSDDGPGSRRMEKDAAGILTGRLAAFLGDRHIEGRIFGLPSAEGEAVVVRLTETTRVPLPLERLGFGEATREALRQALKRPQGMTIVAGPRESGRTETLYALLAEARRAGGAALTIEARVSHRVAQARQVALDSGDHLSAPALVRAGIAQDCDVILIDSIDDRETARAALDAAMAGIRVLAGISAPDSFTALARLMDLGISPALVAANVPAIAALRLGRRLCTVCKRSQAATPTMCEALHLEAQSGVTLNAPKGCSYCRDTGYKGRVAISEVLPIGGELADLIGQGATRSEIEGFAEEVGFVRLPQDGIARTMAGETSFDEWVRLFGGA